MTEFDAATTVLADITGDYTIDPAHTPPRLRRPPRDGHQGPRPVQRLQRHRPHRHRHPGRSKVDLTITAASVDTGNADRDGHLQSADFFGTAGQPRRSPSPPPTSPATARPGRSPAT